LMPFYTYENLRTGERKEFFFSAEEVVCRHGEHFENLDTEIEGEMWHKCCGYDHEEFIDTPGLDYHESASLGTVFPEEARAHQERARAIGAQVEYDTQRGVAIFRGRDAKKHKAKIIRDRGYFDKTGWTGADPKTDVEAKRCPTKEHRETAAKALHRAMWHY